MRILFFLQEESNRILSEFKSTLSAEELLEIGAKDDHATNSLSLSTRFNTDCTYYLKCEDIRRNGCGSVTEQSTDKFVYGPLQLIIIPPVNKDTGSSGIQDMLSGYCSSEFLEGRLCPNCSKKGFTEKYCVVSTVPSVLTVQIKRSIYDQVSNVTSKDNTRVSFPANLKFSEDTPSFPQMFFPQEENNVFKVYPNCSGLFQETPSSAVFNCVDEINSLTKSNIQYELSSVIRHLGQQMNEGHYTIDVCESGGANNDKFWFHCNDLSIQERSQVY
jgi:ubiquitin C-terminal hydrolase